VSAPTGATLVTGATGLVGLEVVRALLHEDRTVYVHARGSAPGTSALRDLERSGRVRALWGDLTDPDLGLSRATLAELGREVTSVVHAAAHYRLSATRDDVWGANVGGLTHLLAHARHWPLDAFHHVSSITVAGDADGLVPEAPLPRPRRFRNAYEESKWASESIVLERVTVPLRVYRLGIVIGDSSTGATQKFDGPYPSFRLGRRWLPAVIPGRGGGTFPLVTVDMVADVVAGGLRHPPAGQEVMHLIDLDAPTFREFSAAMLERLAGHTAILAMPERAFLRLVRLPLIERLVGLERTAPEYACARSVFGLSALEGLCARAGIRGARVKDAYDAIALHYATIHGRAFRPQDG